MTTTLHRPASTPPSGSLPDPLRAGIPAAAWAFVAGLVAIAFPVLIAWAADSRSASGARAAVATVGQVFLAAQGTGLSVPGGELDLLPLGLTLLPLLLLARAGRHAATSHPVPGLGDAARLTAAIALPYATLTAFLAAVSGTDQVQPAPVQALLGGLLVATLAAGAGVLRGAHLGPALRSAVPARVVVVLTAARPVVVGLLGAGALLAGVSLARHAGRATDLADATGPGVVGGLLLLVLGLALVPVAAVWGAAWVVGPGFAVGVGTSVGPFGTELGPVPAVPILAALPSDSPPTWFAVLVLLVPLGLGVVAGLVVERERGRVVDALLVGPAVGLALGALCVLTAGPVGGERLTEVGPTGWLVGLCVAAQVSLAAGAWVAARAFWSPAPAPAPAAPLGQRSRSNASSQILRAALSLPASSMHAVYRLPAGLLRRFRP